MTEDKLIEAVAIGIILESTYPVQHPDPISHYQLMSGIEKDRVNAQAQAALRAVRGAQSSVYIAMHAHEYRQRSEYILGVFSTKEKAIKFIRETVNPKLETVSIADKQKARRTLKDGHASFHSDDVGYAYWISPYGVDAKDLPTPPKEKE